MCTFNPNNETKGTDRLCFKLYMKRTKAHCASSRRSFHGDGNLPGVDSGETSWITGSLRFEGLLFGVALNVVSEEFGTQKNIWPGFGCARLGSRIPRSRLSLFWFIARYKMRPVRYRVPRYDAPPNIRTHALGLQSSPALDVFYWRK